MLRLARIRGLRIPSINAYRHFRCYSSVNPVLESDRSQATTSETSPEQQSQLPQEESTSTEVPWYMRHSDAKNASESKHITEIPTLENSPASLEPILKHMAIEIGLDDLQLVDLRELDPPSSFGPAILVLASGKSDKHLTRASLELSKWIKNTYGVLVGREGLVTSNFLRVHQRRLRKRANKASSFQMRQTDAIEPNSWVILDTKVDNLYIHLFTPQRREQLGQFWVHEQESELENAVTQQPVKNSSSELKGGRYTIPGLRRDFHTLGASQARMPTSETRKQPQKYPPTNKKMGNLVYQRTLAATAKYQALVSYSRSYECIQALVLKAHINYLSRQIPNRTDKLTPTVPIVRQSDVVQSFMTAFPSAPQSEHWKLRQIFLILAHRLNADEFPIQCLIENAIYQQASGFPLDEQDVQMLITAITYSFQTLSGPQAQGLKPLNHDSTLWAHMCNEKFKYVLQLMSVTCRPSGQKISASDSLLALLYRICIRPTKLYITHRHLKKQIVPRHQLRRGFLDPRFDKVLSLFKDIYSESEASKSILAMCLTSLANDLQWDKFWMIWNNVMLTKDVDSNILHYMVTLVVKAADEVAITHLIEYYLPSLLVDRRDLITPSLLGIIETGLNYINPSGKGYKSLRALLEMNRGVVSGSKSNDAVSENLESVAGEPNATPISNLT
uniref:ATPase synthesis protein 25 n=1 Tax=Blastobotrys adeninivorans TaxID=409370 RepID=A0A060THB7_BLAAD